MVAYKTHPAAELLPPLTDDEYAALRADIEAKGLIHPIVLHKGKVLDGRHRLRACEDLGIEPRFHEDDELAEVGGLPELYVESTAIHRQLSASQRAMLAARNKPHHAKLAKIRQRALNGRTELVDTCPQAEAGKSRDAAGAAHGVSGRTVDRACRVADSGCPQLIQAVRDDRVDVATAERLVKSCDTETLPEVVAVAMVSDDPKKAIKAAIAKPKSQPTKPKKKPQQRASAKARKAMAKAIENLEMAIREMGLTERCSSLVASLHEELNNA